MGVLADKRVYTYSIQSADVSLIGWLVSFEAQKFYEVWEYPVDIFSNVVAGAFAVIAKLFFSPFAWLWGML